MENQPTVRVEEKRSIQDYLSLGYIYLLLLGITSDSVYFNLIGINILEYSTVVDVLLSPIIYLTKSLIFPVVILVIPVLSYFFMQFQDKKAKEKSAHQKEKEKKMTIKMSLTSKVLLFSAFTIFSAYLGYGLGGGQKMKDRLQSGDFSMTHQLTFTDGEILKVRLVDHNSLYVFYVIENGKTVTVAPIDSNIKKIEELE